MNLLILHRSICGYLDGGDEGKHRRCRGDGSVNNRLEVQREGPDRERGGARMGTMRVKQKNSGFVGLGMEHAKKKGRGLKDLK